MKKTLLLSWAILWIVVTTLAQAPAFKRTGTNLPFAGTIASNQVFNIDRGGGLPPANLPYGVLRDQVRSEFDSKHAPEAPDIAPVNAFQVKRLLERVYSRQKFTVAYLGDSTGVDVLGPVEDSLLAFFPRAGGAVVHSPNYGPGYMGLNRSDVNNTSYYNSGLDGVFWGKFCALGNGTSIFTSSASSNYIAANQIGAAWYQSSGFGTMLVETQNTSGVWGTVTTISGAGGAGLTMATTNITIPAGSYNLRLTSTGTNIPVAMKLYDTSSGIGWRTASMDTPGVSPIGYMINAGSNNVAKFFAWLNPDVIFYKAERITTATNELPWFEGLISATVPLCDVVYVPYHTNAADTWAVTNRDYMLYHARRFRRAVVDGFAASLPFSSSSSNALYNADGVHLLPAGQAVLHSRIPSQLGFGAAELYALGLRPIVGAGFVQTNDTTKGQLTGGNSWTGPQIFNGWFDVKGTFNGDPAIGIWNNTSDQKFNIHRFGDAFVITDSTASYGQIFAVSNISGQSCLEMLYRHGVFGRSKPFSYYGTNFIQSSNLPPPGPFRAGDAFTWNSNGVVYLLTSGIGNTWTATNKLAP